MGLKNITTFYYQITEVFKSVFIVCLYAGSNDGRKTKK